VTPDEREAVLETAAHLLSAGRADELVAELADAGLGAELWSDTAAVAGLFELHGKHLAASRLLDLAMQRPADGWGCRVVLPLPGSPGPPGQVRGATVAIAGVVLSPAAAPEADARYVLAVDSGDVVLVAGLHAGPAAGFDPELGLARISGQVTVGDCTPAPGDWGWDTLVTRGARALGYELLGLGGLALRIAKDYVGERRQFGHPIGAFQSVRHRLADAHIALTGAREVLDGTDEAVEPALQVLLIKALAGRAALRCVQAAQQVCGAMGFTAEFGLHRVVRRTYLLDSLLGGSEWATHELGNWALRSGRAPDRLMTL